MKRRYSRPATNKGWFTGAQGNTCYLKSGWELQYAKYLDTLLANGTINKWEYEPSTFWFLKILRGVRSYTPDFKVEYADGSIEYHEVKGYLDSKSKTKLKRMRIYHPEIKMKLIDRAVMEELGLLDKLKGEDKNH